MRLIDADAFRVFLDRQYHNCHGYVGNKKEIYREALLAVKSYVHREGQIDAEPVRHGHWIYRVDEEGVPLYYCSRCDGGSARVYPFCRECGAKMDLEVIADEKETRTPE